MSGRDACLTEGLDDEQLIVVSAPRGEVEPVAARPLGFHHHLTRRLRHVGDEDLRHAAAMDQIPIDGPRPWHRHERCLHISPKTIRAVGLFIPRP